MPIKRYEVRRFATGLTSWVDLCDVHVERRRIVGYRFIGKPKDAHTLDPCDDCRAAQQPTVLDVAMAADPDLRRLDKQNETPEPVPVLKGQRTLF